MTLKLAHKFFLSLIIILSVGSLPACTAVTSVSTPAGMVTSTMVPTKTRVPAATNALTAEPSATLTPLPTISFATETISSTNIDQMKELHVRELAGKPGNFFSQRLSFTADGHTVVATNITKIYVWDGTTGQPIAAFNQPSYIWNITISPNRKIVASFDDNGVLKLWNVQTGEEKYTLAHKVVWTTVWSLAFSPDNMILASGDFDGKVTFWDTHAGKELNNIVDPNGSATSIAFSPDGKVLAIGTQDRITLWDIVSKQLIRTLDFGTKQDEFEGIRRVFFSPDGGMIAATHTKNIAMVWDVSSGKKLSTIVGQPVLVRACEGALAFSPDSKIIATGNDDAGGIILWDSLANKELRTIGSEKCIPMDLDFLNRGSVLEIGCNNGTIQFWGLP